MKVKRQGGVLVSLAGLGLTEHAELGTAGGGVVQAVVVSLEDGVVVDAGVVVVVVVVVVVDVGVSIAVEAELAVGLHQEVELVLGVGRGGHRVDAAVVVVAELGPRVVVGVGRKLFVLTFRPTVDS